MLTLDNASGEALKGIYLEEPKKEKENTNYHCNYQGRQIRRNSEKKP